MQGCTPSSTAASGLRQERQRLLRAAGLALFAASGGQKALAFRLSPLASVLLGVLPCIGGGR